MVASWTWYADVVRWTAVVLYIWKPFSCIKLGLFAGEAQKISDSDKTMVRDNILGFILQVPPLLRYTPFLIGGFYSDIVGLFICVKPYWRFLISVWNCTALFQMNYLGYTSLFHHKIELLIFCSLFLMHTILLVAFFFYFDQIILAWPAYV